jgi:flagellar biosynthesis protein FliP
MMTSFTRIVVVLAILRQGMGTQQTPYNQILIGLALFLSVFVMAPVLERIYERGRQALPRGVPQRARRAAGCQRADPRVHAQPGPES